MDVTILIGFLTGGSIVASLVMAVFKDILNAIPERYGPIAKQVTLFVISLILAILLTASVWIPTNIWVIASGIFMGAIAVYEVLYKAIYVNLMGGPTAQ